MLEQDRSASPSAVVTGQAKGPNVFLAGAAKCGTSSLARYLTQHPEVFSPSSKEPNYFVAATTGLNAMGPIPEEQLAERLHRFSYRSADRYEREFAVGSDFAVRLDASVRYLYHPRALCAAVDAYPDARFIVVLRSPADRMLSHWRMNRQEHLEPLGFAAALEAEDGRVALGWGWDWHYRRVSDYAPQLRHLLDLVGPKQLHVVYYRDFERNADTVLASIEAFLGLTAHRYDTSKRAKVPYEYRIAAVDHLIHHPNRYRSALQRFPGSEALFGAIDRRNRRPLTPVPARERALAEEQTRHIASDVAEVLGRDLVDVRRGLGVDE